MSNKSIFFLLVIGLSFSVSQGFSQELKLPENFSNAIEKGTRTEMGIPGTSYWQNAADYEIMVSVFPDKKMLEGKETITYYNNSPDTLHKIVLKIYQNLYKKGVPRDVSIHEKDLHDGVEVVFPEETKENLIDTIIEMGTNLEVYLKSPLYTEDSVQLRLDWKSQIPSQTDIRMGAMDDSAFFLGFWYPRVAVYDDIKGWDLTPHTGNQEFYHDKGDYEVYIHVPQGYFVVSTGLLQNEHVVLKNHFLDRYQQAKTGDKITGIIKEEDLASMNENFRQNVWIYKAKQVPDFAFGMSNHHLWDARSMVIDSVSLERVLVQSAYKPEAKDFREVVKFASQSIEYLSFEFPGYPYPFPSCAIYHGTNGTSGMEYPMIANNPSAERRGRTLDVTAHEIAHNYFPFYVLTNETDRAWMDEAFAAMIPYKLQERIEPSLNRLTRYADRISDISNTREHISTMALSSAISSRRPYYFTNYTKPAVALYFLEEVLGTEHFKDAILEYITVWEGKHPTAWDFFYLMNRSAGQDLSWYWKPWFFETAFPDLAIKEVEEKTNAYDLIILRKGNLPVPVNLLISFQDGTTHTVRKSAEVWKDGNNHLVIPIETNKKIASIQLGNEYIPDVNPGDNWYKK